MSSQGLWVTEGSKGLPAYGGQGEKNADLYLTINALSEGTNGQFELEEII